MRHFPTLAALAVVLGSAVVNGIWTQRWQRSPEIATAVVRLNDVPLSFGDWQGEALSTDLEAIAQARLAGCWTRRYTRHNTSESVTIVLMCGRPGPVSAHTPEWCFQGVGYELVAEPNRRALIASGDDEIAPEFWTAEFRKPASALPDVKQVWWAWSADRAWQAPSRARLAFGRVSALYKLYVIGDADANPTATNQARIEAFLHEFLPSLNDHIFPRETTTRLANTP